MDQFKVGIMIELQDRFSAGLKTISGALHGAHTQLNNMNTAAGKLVKLQESFSKLGSIGNSIATAGAGGLSAVIDTTKEYTHQLNLMNMAGMKQIDIQKNIEAAWKTSDTVVTSNVAQNLESLADMRAVLPGRNSLEEARDLLPFMQKASAALDASKMNLGGHSGHDTVFSAVKAVEMMGRKLDAPQMRTQLDEMIRTGIASNGRVTPESYQQMLKYARQSKMTLSNDFLYNKAPELMIEYQNSGGKGGGGGGIGAMLAAGYRQIVMGTLNKVASSNLQNLGLLTNPTLKTTTTGTTVQKFDGVSGAKIYASDPSVWVEKFLIPALERKNPSIKGDANATNMAIAQTFKGNQLAVSLYQDLHNKVAAMAKFRHNRDEVGGVEKSYKKSLNDPGVAQKALDAQFENLKTAIGKDVLPVIIPGLIRLAQGFGQAAKFISANPIIGQTIASFMGALAVVGSGISVLAGLLGSGLALQLLGVTRPFILLTGWIGIAIGAITLIGLAVMNWDKVTAAFNNTVVRIKAVFLDMGDRFPQIRTTLQYLVDTMRAWRDAIPGITTAIQNFISTVAGMAGKLASGIGSALFGPVTNADAINARFDANYGHKSKSTVVNHAPEFHTTVNVQGGHADMKKLAKDLGAVINDAHRRAAASHPLAGGDYISHAHAGAH